MMNAKKLRFGLLFAAVVIGCGGPSYRLNLKNNPLEFQMKDFNWPSGLRIVFQEDHSQPSVMVATVVDVGSAEEPLGKEGMAHLVEHLCFRAVHGNKPKIWDQIKQVGAGFFNATTSNDRTDYFTMAPKESLQTLLEIEAMRMINPLEGVTQADVDAEREIVRNELRLRYENDTGSIWLETSPMLYPKGHPYARDTIGTHDSLNNITMQDIQDFVKKHYVPENMTIVVAGDFDIANASTIVQKAFPPAALVKPGTPPGSRVAMIDPVVREKGKREEPPAPVEKGPKKIRGPVTNPVVVLAWSLPAGWRDDQALIEVTAAAMSDAIYSLLFPEGDLEEDRKVDSLGCGADPGRYGTTVYCFVELAEGQNPERIAKKALDGLVEFWRAENIEGLSIGFVDGEGPGESIKLPGSRQVFADAKGRYQAELFRSSGSLLRAWPIAHYIHFTGRADYFTARIQEVTKINVVDAADLAYKYLNRDRAVTLIMEPYDEKEKKATTVAADTSSSWAGATYGSSSKGMFADYAKLTPADIQKLAVAPDVQSVKELTLPNGLKVFLKKHGTVPFVSVALYSHGAGRTASPWGFPDWNVTTFDSVEPGKVAGAWSGFGWQDANVRGVETPSGNLSEALDLVYDRVRTTRSLWTRRKFDRMVDRYKTQQKTQERRPEIWASRAMNNLLLPNHPFGRQDYDIAAISKLGASDYDSWLKKHLSPKNSALFIVGDINMEEAEKKVTAVFSKWRANDTGSMMSGFPPPPPRPSRQIAFIDDPERTQAQITIGCHITPVTAENEAARAVFLKMLGEDVWAAIRERAGASYGVYPWSQASADGAVSLLYIGGAVQNDKAKPAFKTMLDRLGEIRAGKVDSVKLNETKWLVAAGTRSDNQSADEMLYTLAATFRQQRPLTTLSAFPERLAKVTVKDLQDILEPCVGHEVSTIIGPEKQLRSQFESLKIPVETVDWRKGSDAKPDVETKQSAP